ncbi:multicopper oxidase family protein [Streptosporangium sp. CA-135522]|uniref:multicopper oxidase family protein n=1 Tax=Streptosporangium sp. CA-135522 TaxID=3240072 RepID=UPI003D8A2810
MLNRRNMLAVGALTLGGAMGVKGLLFGDRTAFSAVNQRVIGSAAHVHGVRPARIGAAPAVAPFSVRMPVPPVLRPMASTADADIYRIDIRPANIEILPGVSTPVFTYGGQLVGPTIRARTGRRVMIRYGNGLDRPTNVHLHGGHVEADNDGHPMEVIQPGRARWYNYPNRQQGATLWYHDHSHHTEAENVYRGLHGFYLVDDDSERSLRLPQGEYDVPIMLRDALFDADGGMVFGGNPAERGTMLANGKPQPYFPVAARKYRFRLLNSATERTFLLNLGGAEMTQIASDGGLLPAPVPRTEIRLSSAERVEVVVDFSRYPVGTQLVLSDGVTPLLRFDVVRRAVDFSRVPDRLRPLPVPPPATVMREVTLGFDMAGAPVGLVNGKTFDPNRVDFQVRRGTTEIWNITNKDSEFGFTHNFHMHLVQFQVLDRDGRSPSPDDAGRKDTVLVPPGTSVRVQATFADYLGRYVYHCHFLEHSSLGMMAQMEIVP